MARLTLVADCAYPFDYSRLPRGVAVILGYVGSLTGTPNVWTQPDVDQVRATGRAWCPIWTPAAAVLSAQLGLQAGNEMLAALAGYDGLAGCPVFLDIEQHVYAADPAGAKHAWRAWQDTMHAGGHPVAWPYLPLAAGYGWRADWTGTRPKVLPAGIAGWQYEGHVDADRYDLSVFDHSVFTGWISQSGGAAMPLSKDDRKFIVEQCQSVQDNVLARLRGIYHDGWDGHPHPAALTHLADQLADVGKAVAGLPAAGIDPGHLAGLIAAQLGPDVAKAVADELHRRLAG